jgi:hypothetical protein
MYKFGFGGVTENSSPNPQPHSDRISDLESKIISVRVVDIILDDTHPKFKNYGGWNGIGTIEFEDIKHNTLTGISSSPASPLFPNIKNYPLINEIVILFSLPDRGLNEDFLSTRYYYMNPLNIWNHPHHNAFPDSIKFKLQQVSQERDYIDIENGSVKRVKSTSTPIDLNSPRIGGTFNEKTSIHPLLPFSGDIIYEGRFGNSIRFGSTSKSNSKYLKNNWSGGKGENGDPILILRNGQDPKLSNEGWEPTIENINNDLSSIYLTSNQTIPLKISSIEPAGGNIVPFTNIVQQSPTTPESYDKSQIILNSGRILLNTFDSDVLVSSKKTIVLSSIDDIGLSSKKSINLIGKNINLGSKDASQSLILGDNFIPQFKQLIIALEGLCSALEIEPTLGTTPLVASNLKSVLSVVNSNMGNFLSKSVKTS